MKTVVASCITCATIPANNTMLSAANPDRLNNLTARLAAWRTRGQRRDAHAESPVGSQEPDERGCKLIFEPASSPPEPKEIFQEDLWSVLCPTLLLLIVIAIERYEVRPVASGSRGTAYKLIQSLFEEGCGAGLTDGQLLERFAAGHSEAAERAFATLVDRHGADVLRTCRSILRDEHAAEDAFQAVFLVLVRKSRSLWVRRLSGALAAPRRLPSGGAGQKAGGLAENSRDTAL